MTEAAGALTGSADYDAFGAVRSSSGVGDGGAPISEPTQVEAKPNHDQLVLAGVSQAGGAGCCGISGSVGFDGYEGAWD